MHNGTDIFILFILFYLTRLILEKMGLQGTVTPLQAKKKWDNLKKKYKVLFLIVM